MSWSKLHARMTSLNLNETKLASVRSNTGPKRPQTYPRYQVDQTKRSLGQLHYESKVLGVRKKLCHRNGPEGKEL